MVFMSALWMWTPVIGPIPEVRISPQGQIVYLFLMSVIPTVPAGFLTFAEGTLYEAYDHEVRLFGMSVATDQQMAGLIMKLVGGFYLWGWIIYRFFQFSGSGRGTDAPIVVTSPAGGPERDAPADSDDVDLTYDDVAKAFESSGPAPSERTP
jgi:putative membrane protein